MDDQEIDIVTAMTECSERLQKGGASEEEAHQIIMDKLQDAHNKALNQKCQEPNLFAIVSAYSEPLQEKGFSKKEAEDKIRVEFKIAARENVNFGPPDRLFYGALVPMGLAAGGLFGALAADLLHTNPTVSLGLEVVAAVATASAIIYQPYKLFKNYPPFYHNQLARKGLNPTAKGSVVIAEQTIDALVEKYGVERKALFPNKGQAPTPGLH